jgi:hypothetical protein
MSKFISTRTIALTTSFTTSGGLFSAPRRVSRTRKVLDSTELVHSLYVIKEESSQQHVKNNIQTLIDQIRDQDLDY